MTVSSERSHSRGPTNLSKYGFKAPSAGICDGLFESSMSRLCPLAHRLCFQFRGFSFHHKHKLDPRERKWWNPEKQIPEHTRASLSSYQQPAGEQRDTCLSSRIYSSNQLEWTTCRTYLRWGLVTLPIIAWTCWASHTHKLRSTASVFPLKLYTGTDSRTGSTIDHKSWTPITTPVCLPTDFTWRKTAQSQHCATTTQDDDTEVSNCGAAEATFQLV